LQEFHFDLIDKYLSNILLHNSDIIFDITSRRHSARRNHFVLALLTEHLYDD